MYVFTCVCNWRYYQYSQRLSPLNVVSSNLVRDEVYSVQQYVIKFVSNLRQIFSTNKTNRHDITEILLKVALNTINQPTVLTTIAQCSNTREYLDKDRTTKHIDVLIERTCKQLNILRKLKYRLKRDSLEKKYSFYSTYFGICFRSLG